MTDRPRITHDLKCWPEPFAAVRSHAKGAEFRKNDRDFQVGDYLRLQEWRPEPMTNGFTGNEVMRVITHVQSGFGIPSGFVVLSIARV